MDLYEQVVHTVMEWPESTKPQTQPASDHLDVMLLKSDINIDCSARCGAKSIHMTQEALLWL